MRIRYLNTDLDLVAVRDLTPLTSALNARAVFPLSVDRGGDGLWYATLELETDDFAIDPEGTIRGMLDAIEAIDGEAKQLWAESSLREFNIGYDCGDEPQAFSSGLSNATLNRIASVGASLRITLYPVSENTRQNQARLDDLRGG